MTWQVINGNNIDILKKYDDDTFDSIVTDPPYGIEFLGKDWDKNTGAMETWQECFRVLKPGGHLLAFSAARTYHHLATNIEMAGFEIRDQLMWLYGTGFPKSSDVGKKIQKRQGVEEYGDFVDTTKNVGFGMTDHQRVKAGVEWSTKATKVGSVKCTSPEAKQWEGWGTHLKPAHEPIVMARKPFKGSTVDNVLEHGTGALNIDASKIGNESRFPSNVIIDEEAGAMLDAQAPKTGNGHRAKTKVTGYGKFGGGSSSYAGAGEKVDGLSGASKFFYCPKVSRAERHVGLEKMPEAVFGDVKGCYDDGKRFASKHQELQSLGNNHPTVKPVELMKYLIRLVTPENGKVLDPFNGSGSAGMACVELGHDYVGCELDPEYVEISKKRISAWQEKYNTDLFEYKGVI